MSDSHNTVEAVYKSRSIRLAGESELETEGEKAALFSGAMELRDDDPLVRAGCAGAQALACQHHLDRFNTEKHQADARRKEENDAALAERAELLERRRHAVVRKREAAERLAATREPGPKPGIRFLIVLVAALLIAFSVAPAVHDLFLDVHNAVVVWLISFAVGLATGFVVAVPIASSLSAATSKSLWALIPAGVVASGILLLRLSCADGWRECLGALALAAFEVGTVLTLELLARQKRPRYQDWRKDEDVREAAANEDAAATADLREIDEGLARAQKTIDDFQEYLEFRMLRNMTADQLQTTYVNAWLAGFARGVAQNRGRFLGVRRPQ